MAVMFWYCCFRSNATVVYVVARWDIRNQMKMWSRCEIRGLLKFGINLNQWETVANILALHLCLFKSTLTELP
jgi:hypothetical protein